MKVVRGWHLVRLLMPILVFGMIGCGSGSDEGGSTVLPAVRIKSFIATPAVVNAGESTTLITVYENGGGVVDHSLGSVPSGEPGIATGPLLDTTTFTLSVVNAAGDIAQATTVVTVPVATATGSLLQPRYRHTATRLLNGKVLTLGGVGDNVLVPGTAELYDPSTGTSSPTGPPVHSRLAHTATLLPDGRVLVAGGVRDTSAAELYDPATGTFTLTGPMIASRHYATATLLPNGKVLVVGGVNTKTNEIHTSAETYDPATGVFKATAGSMAIPRLLHTAILIPGGKVLLAGGSTEADGLTMVEQFDPTTESFSTNGSLLQGRALKTSTLLLDGKVLIVAGWNMLSPFEYIGNAEEYDPVDGSSKVATGYLGTLRAIHTATLLSSGSVVIMGGEGPEGYQGTVELFDPYTRKFTSLVPTLPTRRAHHTATLLMDGRILISGGMNQDGILASQELYGPRR